MHAHESAKSLEASRQKAKLDAEVCPLFPKLKSLVLTVYLADI